VLRLGAVASYKIIYIFGYLSLISIAVDDWALVRVLNQSVACRSAGCA
jgi:hypothetical protein